MYDSNAFEFPLSYLRVRFEGMPTSILANPSMPQHIPWRSTQHCPIASVLFDLSEVAVRALSGPCASHMIDVAPLLFKRGRRIRITCR